jgi:hypothetical protein
MTPHPTSVTRKPRRVLLGGVLYLVAISVLAFAVGAFVRLSAGALATVLGLLLPVVQGLVPHYPGRLLPHREPVPAGHRGSHQLLATQASIDQPGRSAAHQCWTRGRATA